MRILITPTSLSRAPDTAALNLLRERGAELIFNPHGRPMTESELAASLPGVDGVIAGLDPFSGQALAAADQLRVIARYGVGYDRVDLDATASRNITVTNTPGANGHSVAELAIGLMFSAARQIPRASAEVHSGGWPRVQGIELARRTLGVVGLGAIGRDVAAMAAGIGMDVVGMDPGLAPEQIRDFGVEPTDDLDELCARSDVLSLHIPLVESTRGIIGADRMARLPADAIIINTARGGLIDEAAAVAALDEGRLHGVGVDAYESEPPISSRLVGHPKVVAMPHSGAHSEESVERTAAAAVENLLAVLDGGRPPSPVG